MRGARSSRRTVAVSQPEPRASISYERHDIVFGSGAERHHAALRPNRHLEGQPAVSGRRRRAAVRAHREGGRHRAAHMGAADVAVAVGRPAGLVRRVRRSVAGARGAGARLDGGAGRPRRRGDRPVRARPPGAETARAAALSVRARRRARCPGGVGSPLGRACPPALLPHGRLPPEKREARRSALLDCARHRRSDRQCRGHGPAAGPLVERRGRVLRLHPGGPLDVAQRFFPNTDDLTADDVAEASRPAAGEHGARSVGEHPHAAHQHRARRRDTRSAASPAGTGRQSTRTRTASST